MSTPSRCCNPAIANPMRSRVALNLVPMMRLRRAWSALWVATLLAATVAQAAPDAGPGAAQELDPNLVRKLTPGQGACLGDGTGFVRARIRGALNVDLNW